MDQESSGFQPEMAEGASSSAPDELPSEPEVAAELVSEDVLGADVDDASEILPEQSNGHTSAELDRLFNELEALNLNPKKALGRIASDFTVTFDLPAGRSTRPVVVDANDARHLLDGGVAGWKSLERYDGVWNGALGIVEVAIRSDRLTPVSYLLRRLAGAAGRSPGDQQAEVVVRDEAGEVMIRLGEASAIGKALLSDPRLPRRPPATLTISPVALVTTAEADALAERIADSVAMEASLTLGVNLSLRRLEKRPLVARSFRQRPTQLAFPKNAYQREAVALYQAGREHQNPPLIRYWAFYQVLEFFFPRWSHAEALAQLSRHLKSPVFDPHNDEHVLAAATLAASVHGAAGSEEEQLHTTLRAIVTVQEIVDHIEGRGLSEHLSAKDSEISRNLVRVNQPDDLLRQVSRRIYDIRCRIVHSKNGSERGAGAGLLPGTHHDDLIRGDLWLVEFLAEQALLASAGRLAVPRL